jgi:hypothetical protein
MQSRDHHLPILQDEVSKHEHEMYHLRRGGAPLSEGQLRKLHEASTLFQAAAGDDQADSWQLGAPPSLLAPAIASLAAQAHAAAAQNRQRVLRQDEAYVQGVHLVRESLKRITGSAVGASTPHDSSLASIPVRRWS